MNYALILQNKYADQEWTIRGDSYEGLTWKSDTPKPTKEELESLWEEVKKQQQIEQVERDRRNAYRNESDPLYLKWQRNEATEKDWLDKIEEIKARFPKPE